MLPHDMLGVSGEVTLPVSRADDRSARGAAR
ncbi:hypothetical protein SCE1572_42975 [Sorangium cellulosum So0157-2]|uniref:Uncharacterized protein n=1 Tax=Sorangium cellulosum So0157-2 TaxID=1254432 RepID=S4Y8I0_SORCE|nr:hypothetical protein SCE1572_42975 [Sorangium cellulosum So0157-2]